MIGALEKYAHFNKKKAEMKAMMKRLWKHNDQNPEAQAIKKEKDEDRPAQLAAEKVSHQEIWKETVRVNRLARMAGEEERERIKKQGGLENGKLRKSAILHSLPHDGKKKEDMTDDERVERGAAVSSCVHHSRVRLLIKLRICSFSQTAFMRVARCKGHGKTEENLKLLLIIVPPTDAFLNLSRQGNPF
jgi:hypothetical protein